MDPAPEFTPASPIKSEKDNTPEHDKPIEVGKRSVDHEGRKVSSDPQNLPGDATSSIGKSSFSQRAYIADNSIKPRDIHLITTEEAAKLLPNGTFLVRKSVGSPGNYSVTWKTLDGKIDQARLNSKNLETINKDIHALIKSNGVNKYQTDKLLQPAQSKEFKLISSTFTHADLTPTPGLRHFLKLDPKVAESMLPVNSYLVRESSLPNLITLTIKDDQGKCIHQRLKLESLPHIHERPELKDKKEVSQLDIKKRFIHNFKSYDSELAEVEFKENKFIGDDFFCVRESPSQPNKYVLSIKDENGTIVHYDLESTDLSKVNEEVNYINKCVSLDNFEIKISSLMSKFESINSKEDALNYLFSAGDLYKRAVDIGHPLFSLNNITPFDAKYATAEQEVREFNIEFIKGVTELTRLYLGNEVKNQSQNEIAFWKLSEHKGVKTLNEMKTLIPSVGDWAIYYNQETNTNILIVNCTVTWGQKSPLFDIDKTPLNINPDHFQESMLRKEDTLEILKKKIENLRENVAGG